MRLLYKAVLAHQYLQIRLTPVIILLLPKYNKAACINMLSDFLAFCDRLKRIGIPIIIEVELKHVLAARTHCKPTEKKFFQLSVKEFCNDASFNIVQA